MQCSFYRAVHCNVMRQLKAEARMGLKTDDLVLTQNMFRKIFVIFGRWCSKALNVQFHSNSFIKKCPKTTLWMSNVFHGLSTNYFPALLSFLLALLSHVKLLKVSLAFFMSWIFLTSYRKPCHYNLTGVFLQEIQIVLTWSSLPQSLKDFCLPLQFVWNQQKN